MLESRIFINFTLFIVLPLVAVIAPSIWTLEGLGLRYYNQEKKNVITVVDEYKTAIKSITWIGAVTSFISLLYDIMITNGLGFDYVLNYFALTTLLIYPPTLLVTAIYIHFSETKSIEKILKKMRNNGFSLPQASSIEIK
ncbi:MAG: hypothetical protein V1850_01040 [Candidatus Bathyarchaeota archaeon]